MTHFTQKAGFFPHKNDRGRRGFDKLPLASLDVTQSDFYLKFSLIS